MQELLTDIVISAIYLEEEVDVDIQRACADLLKMGTSSARFQIWHVSSGLLDDGARISRCVDSISSRSAGLGILDIF